MQAVRQVAGGVHVLDRADVDTDQIIPKQFLKRIERTGFGEFLFRDWRRDGLELDPECPILVTGRNFGCGSSREHAVWALQDFGFEVVVSSSFADIFYSNCTKNGMLPIVLPEDEVRALMAAREALVDLERQIIQFDDHELTFDISEGIKQRLLKGLDDISLTLEHEADVERFESEREPIGSLTTSI
ncbi:MAG: 3-isopropylmalate dehydratase small subunit [Solirubrobacterales bacterium]